MRRRSSPKRPSPTRIGIGVAIAALLAAPLSPIFTPTVAQAAPGTPGVPSDPEKVFIENFEHNTGAAVVPLEDYIGAQGTTYTADAPWLNITDCNNLILRYDNPIWQPEDCDNATGVRSNVQRLADVLGQVGAGIVGNDSPSNPHNGSTAATRLNHASSAFTYRVNMADDLTVFESSVLPERLKSGRFYTASIDVAELSCEYLGGINNSLLDFELLVDGTGYPLQSNPIRACTDSRVSYYTSPPIAGNDWGSGGAYVGAGVYFSDRSFLMPAGATGSARLKMTNQTGDSQGNDFAYDNVELLDATPQMDKIFAPSTIVSGENSVLTFTVTNTSDLAEKRGWSFTDNLPSGLVISDETPPQGTCVADVSAPPRATAINVTNGLLEENQVSCTINVSVTSTATLGGTDPPLTFSNCATNITNSVGVDLPACADLTLTPPPFSALSILKTADREGLTAADDGEVVTYTFLVKNEGTTTLTGVTPEEIEFTGTGTMSGFTPGPVTLEPGASQPFTATYTLQPEDLLLDSIDNTARAAGLDPDNARVISDEDSWDIEAGLWGQLELVKTSDVTRITEDMVGQTITYSFEVTNIGTAPMTEVKPVDTQFNGSGTLGEFTPASVSLAPNETRTFTAEYVITEEDIRLETLTNTAYATGIEPDGETEDSPPDNHEVPVEKFNRLEMVKTSDIAEIDSSMVGDTITYKFTITNTGTRTALEVEPEEVDFNGTGELSAFSPGPVTLEPGQSQDFYATYVLQEADFKHTELTNTALATGLVPGFPPVESPPDDNTIVIEEEGRLSIIKSSETEGITFDGAGEIIEYNFMVTNTGNVELTGVTPEETQFSGNGTIGAYTPGPVTLQPGESQLFTAEYTVLPADLADPRLINTAVAVGTEPGGDPITSPPSEWDIEIGLWGQLELVKTSDVTRITEDMVGQTITYSFEVTNIGTAPMTEVKPVDTQFNGSGTLGEFTPASVSLAPNETRTFTAEYVITEEDIRLETLTNTAYATGIEPDGETEDSPPDNHEVPVEKFNRLEMVKTSNTTTIDLDSVGSTITYQFRVENTGTTTLTDVTPVEVSFNGTGELGAFSPEPQTLEPGKAVIFTADYVIQLADVQLGTLTNTAIAEGITPDGPPVESPPDEETIVIEQQSRLSIEKTSSVETLTVDSVGEVITYEFLVTNTGNETLEQVTPVEVNFSGSGTLGAFTPEPVTLAPGASQVFTAEYTITIEDVRSASLTNTAIATGVVPGTPPGTPPIESPPGDNTITVEREGRLDLVKTSSVATINADSVGEVITYEFLVTNTGNETLEQVTPVEVNFSGSGTLGAFTPEPVTLAPGASQVFTAEYTITIEDVRSASLTNTAIATGVVPGTPPGTPPIESPPGDNTIVVDRVDGLTIVKRADTTQLTQAGQRITYTFEVTNHGQTVLTDVRVNELEFSGSGTIGAITPKTVTLQPGETQVFTGVYVVTAADMAAGDLTNTANASGTNPGGEPVDSPRASVTVQGATQLSKTGSDASLMVIAGIGALLLVAGATVVLRRRQQTTV